MRRAIPVQRTSSIPVYLLLDCSTSMTGDPLAALESGLSALLSEIRSDSLLRESVWLSIITFSSSASVVLPLTPVDKVSLPRLEAGGSTSLAAALRLLTTQLPASPSRPLVFLMTDGAPNPGDDWRGALRPVKARQPRLVACAAGTEADRAVLRELTDDVIELKDTSPECFRSFFGRVYTSVLGENAAWVDAATTPSPSVTLVVDDGIPDQIDIGPLRQRGGETDFELSLLVAAKLQCLTAGYRVRPLRLQKGPNTVTLSYPELLPGSRLGVALELHARDSVRAIKLVGRCASESEAEAVPPVRPGNPPSGPLMDALLESGEWTDAGSPTGFHAVEFTLPSVQDIHAVLTRWAYDAVTNEAKSSPSTPASSEALVQSVEQAMRGGPMKAPGPSLAALAVACDAVAHTRAHESLLLASKWRSLGAAWRTADVVEVGKSALVGARRALRLGAPSLQHPAATRILELGKRELYWSPDFGHPNDRNLEAKVQAALASAGKAMTEAANGFLAELWPEVPALLGTALPPRPDGHFLVGDLTWIRSGALQARFGREVARIQTGGPESRRLLVVGVNTSRLGESRPSS